MKKNMLHFLCCAKLFLGPQFQNFMSCRCGKRKEKLADFLIQALKQGALEILATFSRVLTSAKNKNRFLKRASRPFRGFLNFVSMTPVNKVICIFMGLCT